MHLTQNENGHLQHHLRKTILFGHTMIVLLSMSFYFVTKRRFKPLSEMEEEFCRFELLYTKDKLRREERFLKATNSESPDTVQLKTLYKIIEKPLERMDLEDFKEKYDQLQYYKRLNEQGRKINIYNFKMKLCILVFLMCSIWTLFCYWFLYSCGERMPNKPAPVNKSSPMYAGSVMQSTQMSWWWSMR